MDESPPCMADAELGSEYDELLPNRRTWHRPPHGPRTWQRPPLGSL